MGKEISITIKAYNQTKAALSQIKAGFKDLGSGKIGAGFGHFGEGLKQLGRTAGMVTRSVVSGVGKMAAAAAVAGGAVVAIAKKAIDAYKAQAQADARLEQALRNSGYAAGFTATELKKMAAELQKTTGASDDSTESLMAVLATSGQIRGDNFIRATKAALDMGAAMAKAGADFEGGESAAVMLAKALEQPEDGLSRLRRAGVQFTAAQEEQIKAMVEAGDKAGAQAAILAEVERRYKGTAEEQHKAAGQTKDLANSYDDLMEQIGGAINNSDSFKGVLAELSKIISELSESGRIEQWGNNIALTLQGIEKIIRPVVDLFDKLIKMPLEKIFAFAGGFSGAQGGVSERFKAGLETAATTEIREEQELAAIREKNARRKAEIDAKERKEMEAAKPEVAARDAEEKRLREEKQRADAEAKAAKEKKLADDEAEKAEMERLEREADITRELEKQADLRAEIAREEADLSENQQRRITEEAAASARAKAQEMRDKLEARRALGAAGSKELAEADKKERDRDKRVAKIKQDRAQLGLQMGQFGAADIEEGGKLDEQGIAEQERFLQIMRQLHITNRTGKPIGAKELEEEAKKQGRPLNQKDLELVRRAGMQAQEAELAMLAKNWEGMLKANQDAERELREQNQARNIAESKVRLDQIAQDIKKMGVVI